MGLLPSDFARWTNALPKQTSSTSSGVTPCCAIWSIRASGQINSWILMSQFYGKTCILPMKRCHLPPGFSRRWKRERSGRWKASAAHPCSAQQGTEKPAQILCFQRTDPTVPRTSTPRRPHRKAPATHERIDMRPVLPPRAFTSPAQAATVD